MEISALETIEIPEIQLTASVYPNPTIQNVTLFIKDYDLTDLSYILYNIQGKIVDSKKVLQSETVIDMTSLASTHYFLKTTQNASNLKTLKIIKN